MTTWQIGQTIEWELLVTSDGTTPADLGGGLPTATVTLPDGTTAAPGPSVSKVSTGLYLAAMVATVAGRHRIRWTATGTNSGQANGYTDLADVWPADARLIIPLGEARAALNLPAAAITNDSEVVSYIAAATAVIEDLVGPVLPATVVETHSGAGYVLALRRKPAAITSVTEDGTTLASTDYDLDLTAGMLWRGAYPGAATWSTTSASNVVVTYTVGASTIAPNVLLAARELVRFMYQQGQQASRPAFGEVGDGYATTPTGYLVPNRVMELLAPSRASRLPGLA